MSNFTRRSTRALEQLFPRIEGGVVDDCREQGRKNPPDSRPFRHSELEQVDAVDGEVAEPVRPLAFLLQQADEVRRALVLAGRRVAGPEVGLLVQGEIVRHLLAVFREHPPREPRMHVVDGNE